MKTSFLTLIADQMFGCNQNVVVSQAQIRRVRDNVHAMIRRNHKLALVFEDTIGNLGGRVDTRRRHSATANPTQWLHVIVARLDKIAFTQVVNETHPFYRFDPCTNKEYAVAPSVLKAPNV